VADSIRPDLLRDPFDWHRYTTLHLHLALVAARAAIIFNIKARTVAALTGAAFLLLVVFAQIPAQLASHPGSLGTVDDCLQGTDHVRRRMGRGRIAEGSDIECPAAPRSRHANRAYFHPITVAVFGFDHFLYTDLDLLCRYSPNCHGSGDDLWDTGTLGIASIGDHDFSMVHIPAHPEGDCPTLAVDGNE
jgi:hypothetical protein